MNGTGRAGLLVVVIALAAPSCSSGTNDGSAPGPDAAPPASVRTTTTSSPPAVTRDLPTTVEQAADLLGYNIYRPTDLDGPGGPRPVIVWANGGCLRFDGVWAPLLESWARAGFVVVAITTPTGADARTVGMTTADDQARAVDWAYAQGDNADSPYAGHLDLDRVVAAGNSCGGITALALAARDDRVRSVFVLSGSSVFPGVPPEAAAEIMGDIEVPVGYVVGGPEDIAAGNAQHDYGLLAAGVPGYLARRAEGAHEKVSTDEAVLSEVAVISTNWIDFTLYGKRQVEDALLENPCDQCAPGTWTVEAKDLDLLLTR